METDLNDVRDLPIGPLPIVTYGGGRGRSDASLLPARNAQVTPITTGKSLTDRFKELCELHRNQPKTIEPVPEAKACARQGGISGSSSVAAYGRFIKSLRENDVKHRQEMAALQQEQRLKRIDRSELWKPQHLRLGDVRIIGAMPSVRSGFLGDGSYMMRNAIANRIQARSLQQMRPAKSMSLRLGHRNYSNRSAVQISPGDTMRGRSIIDRIGRRDFHRGSQARGGRRSGISATMEKNNSAEFGRGGRGRGLASKNELDMDLDEYMSKARNRKPSQQKLDKELDEYMAATTAARMNKKFAATATNQNSETDDKADGFMDDDDHPTLATNNETELETDMMNGLYICENNDGGAGEQKTNSHSDSDDEKNGEAMDLDIL